MRYTTKQLASVVIDLVDGGKSGLKAGSGSAGSDVSEVADGLVRLLSEQNDLKRMHDIDRAIEQVWKERFGVATLTIETAHPISAALKKQIEKLANGAEVREVVSAELIGGAKLTIDDRVIDGTVTGTLEQLRTTLYGN